jgi:hypothetical protein
MQDFRLVLGGDGRARVPLDNGSAARHTEFRYGFHACSTEDARPSPYIVHLMENRLAGAQSVSGLGGAVVELCEALSDLLADLILIPESPGDLAVKGDGSRSRRYVGWLPPLALASVQLEYVIRHWPLLNATAVAARCDDLARVLDASPFGHGNRMFSTRYATERARSPALAALHARVVEACCDVTARCALAAKEECNE